MIDHGYGVILQPLDSAHSEQLRKWRNDYRVWKWCRQNDLISDVAQERWIERQSSDPTVKMYTIWDKHGSLVGCCGLTSIDQTNQRAEFSVYIDPLVQHRGFAGEALKTLFIHGFYSLNLNLIWGETFAGNSAGKLFEKIGMVKEGSRRDFYYREGRFIACELYSMTRKEWMAQCTTTSESA